MEVDLDRILSAVGDDYVPSNLDRAGLRWDIYHAADWRQAIADVKALSRQRRRAAMIYDTAKELLDLLREDDADQRAVRYGRNPDPITMLCELMVSATEVRNQSSDTLYNLQRSAFEECILCLQLTYESYFGRPATFSRDKETGQPSGPFVRFARACLCEMNISNNGKPYAAESVVSAIRRNKKVAA